MATPAEKQRCLNDLLQQGVVMIALDARRPGVKVPEYLKKEMELRLNFNHRRGKGDLVINDWGVRESLSFRGTWFSVSVPWSAVYLLTVQGADAVLYPEDLPEEMVEAALERLQKEGHSLEKLEEDRPKPLWKPKPVPTAPPLAAEELPPAPSEPEPPKRSHLRLVK